MKTFFSYLQEELTEIMNCENKEILSLTTKEEKSYKK